MLLSTEERAKFAQWCQQEVDSNKAIIKQMENMHLPDALIKGIETVACAVVFKMLTSVESQTIGGTDAGSNHGSSNSPG